MDNAGAGLAGAATPDGIGAKAKKTLKYDRNLMSLLMGLCLSYWLIFIWFPPNNPHVS
jgi:hypothetical protein